MVISTWLSFWSINGWTPLHDAAYNGYFDVVKFLVEQQAEVNAKKDEILVRWRFR
jgi:ankyrin repeat protein